MRPVPPPRRCVWWGSALALALGCGSSAPAPAAPKPAATPSSTEVGAGPPAPAASSAAVPPELPPLLTDGCTARIDPMLPGRQKLDSLARSCIAGMRPIWSEPWMAHAAGSGQERSVPVPDPSRCLRVGAAAGPGVTDIELVLLDPEGRPLAQDGIAGSVALIDLHGPVCANRSGPHRLRVRARGRDEPVATQVWRAP